MFEMVDVAATATERGISENGLMQRHIGSDAIGAQLGQCDARARQGFIACAAMGDELADQRVVVTRNRSAGGHVSIDADAYAAGNIPARDRARRGGERGGILGIDTKLDRMADAPDVGLRDQQRLTRAMRICSLTMSIPVVISVTGCSTWTRVFISMKKNWPSS